jgi:hypothetical protein
MMAVMIGQVAVIRRDQLAAAEQTKDGGHKIQKLFQVIIIIIIRVVIIIIILVNIRVPVRK